MMTGTSFNIFLISSATAARAAERKRREEEAAKKTATTAPNKPSPPVAKKSGAPVAAVAKTGSKLLPLLTSSKTANVSSSFSFHQLLCTDIEISVLDKDNCCFC